MTPAQVCLIGIGLVLFYLLFLKPGNPLFQFTMELTGDLLRPIAARLLWLTRAVLLGYCAYALTALLFSLSRVETFGDIWLVLRTRPSHLGGAGLLGVVMGILFAGWAYRSGGRNPVLQAWFIRGRQLVQAPDAQTSSCLDSASKRRYLNKQQERRK